MGSVLDFVTSSVEAVAQTFAQITEELHRLESTQEQNVAISTNAAFAQTDLALWAYAWGDCNDGEIPPEVQRDAEYGIEEITRNLKGKGKAQSPSDVVIKSRGAAMGVEHLTEELKPPDDQVAPDNPNAVDSSKSKLDSRDLLTEVVQTSLRLLFDALAQQFACCDANHYARLKLTGFINQTDVKSRMFFDLYLSSRHDWKPCRWLESRCTITGSLERRAEPRCNILKKSEDMNKNLNLLLEGAPKSVDPKSQDAHRTQEMPKGGFQVDHCEIRRSSASPIVSLWELLGQSNHMHVTDGASSSITVKERDTLCLNLALSLLQLSGDEWNRVNWCSDEYTSIYFLFDPDTRTVLDKANPYLSWRLGKGEELDHEDPTLLCDPQLLDFAQVLVEIHEWKRLPANLESKRIESLEEFRLALLQHVHDNIRQPQFILALEACVDIAGRRSRNGSVPGEIQNYIWQRILRRLDANALYPELSKPGSELAPLISSDAGDVDEVYDENISYDEPEDRSTHADDFLTRMRQFTDAHIKSLKCLVGTSIPKQNQLDRKIRIAVIDSGVRKDDSRICGWRTGGSIKDCRNFSSPHPEDWNDEIGHGTMVSCLLLDIAPEAELYIAKVSAQNTVPRNKLYCIAKAINWAVQRWQVDIITISLVLSDANHHIDEELQNALNPSFNHTSAKIVFAAAGNKGGNAKRAWPARRSGVIAVHTTDGYGIAANHNPESDAGRVNIATLGRNIRMPWLHDADSDEWKDRFISGTSFATPIAAGIAANVLEFARYKLRLTDRQKHLLFSHHGMRKVLTAMSARNDRDYHYIQPWTLWEMAEKGEWGNWGGRTDVKLFPNSPRNICKVLEFIIGESSY
ncbi:hypothetical protein BP5796_04016 [Coleophoma crateriformis]|uniref:Uncharacterized protein n=1 Tax=Coleophoma crateriformis TaxID=565419 RepID=A0A3D8SHP6_9HELO|nr:hypothetical protein BP5796_04016 [Coleophoma crateriformis]